MLRNKGGDGLWVVVVGACGMEVDVEADDNISHHRLGVFMAWEVLVWSMMAVVGGCHHCHGGDMAHHCYVGVVGGLGMWCSLAADVAAYTF